KRILIDDRNVYMANAIRKLSEEFDSLVAVVGDGHVDGLSQLLEDKELEIIRLKDLRSIEVDGSSVSFSYNLRSE
ncbi:MAG: TraB/GumN family protein, partial [Thermoplasmata archaeon]